MTFRLRKSTFKGKGGRPGRQACAGINCTPSAQSGKSRKGLRLQEEQDQLRAAKLEQLRKEIKAGIDSGCAGELNIGEIKRRGRARLAGPESRR